MSFIKEIVDAYDGGYLEEVKKKFYSPGGQFSYQPMKGVITVDGTKISISFNETQGVLSPVDPVRIILHLDVKSNISLNIFPSTYWDSIVNYFAYPKPNNGSKKLNSQFSFRGDKQLINKLLIDQVFIENIVDEYFYITINKSDTNKVLLTPAHGIQNLDHFKKMMNVLKQIESQIKAIPN
ncbi:MAG: hypothetical protein BM564_13530 [Bacteroidetes bacterium MedPE-SWsnd-G2]|nr:MAG: hypothetical protein BM564_13530 [Bacteroidetes bacterium MedPE-SWsnd-G2]